MKAKIKILISSGILIIAALFFIQLHFLRNTWYLYQQKITTDVKDELNKIEKQIDIDLLRNKWLDNTQRIIASGSPEKIKKYLKNDFDSVTASKIVEAIGSNERVKKFGVLYFVKFTDIQIKYLGDSTRLVVIKNKPWIGVPEKEQFDLAKFTLTQAKSNSTYNNVYCEVHTQSGFSITNLKKEALNNMGGLILFSIFLLGSVIVLFCIAVLNIIKQKKIADIKTEFVNSIRHEFNTPLTTIDIAVAALKTNQDSYNDMGKSSIGIIERQNKRLKLLLKQVIDSSMYMVSAELSRDETEMNAFVETILQDTRNANPGKTFKFTCSLAKITLWVDQLQMTTALTNIIENAVKYGGDIIEITADVTSQEFVLSIKDNGKGIEESYKKKIFEKFQRVPSGNLYNAKGLGLGLYYTKQIIKAHNGNIEVESMPGSHSIFTIKLPLQ